MLKLLLTISALIWIFALLDAVIGFRRFKKIEDAPPVTVGQKLSIIVAAKNEQKALQKSIESQLNQSYTSVEWILVNDRSTDKTGDIMNDFAKIDERVKVIHIEALPNEWLGKNHALYKGYQQASGTIILFTDADVIYENDTLAKAISFFNTYKLDHLTLAPNLYAKPFWLKAFVSFFLFGFSYFKRPWRANVPHSKIGMGIGAFNLISRGAYEKIGTHKAIKMRPDDDLQLGIHVKANGLKQQIASALTLIHVEWYENVREALIGLEKNTFAGLHYRVSMVFLAILGTFISQVLPFITIFYPNNTIMLLSLINILFLACLHTLITVKMTRFTPLLFGVFPITALLFIYSIIRATIVMFKRGGIVWRGTTYRLDELRKHR